MCVARVTIVTSEATRYSFKLLYDLRVSTKNGEGKAWHDYHTYLEALTCCRRQPFALGRR